MKQVIQINSLEAIEKLIGGDSDIEVNIRNNVVQNFSKKYLKSIAHELCCKISDDYILNRVENNIRDELYKYRYDGQGRRIYAGLKEGINPSDEFISQNRKRIGDIVNRKIDETICGKINKIDSYVDTALKDRIDYIMRESGYNNMISEMNKAKEEVETYFKELEKNMDSKLSEMIAEKCRNIMERYKNETK
jgi:hypothetical protein